ncbi:MAG: type I-B CRISPR-associated protein Cas5b [Stygiobacter sp.]
MELLRIKAFQPFACYRKPFSYGFWDTFPLPPFSTLSGLFHCGINAELDKYYPFKVAVVGIIENITYDLQSLIKFDRVRREKEQIILEGFNKALSSTPTYIATITNIYLRIYFQAENNLLHVLKNNLMSNYFPYIGRHEDLARIDQLKIIKPNMKTFSRNERLGINYGIYLKPETAKNIGVKGSNFQIPFRHEEIDGLRYFQKENVVFVDSLDEAVKSGDYLIDEDVDEVFTQPVLIELFGDF